MDEAWARALLDEERRRLDELSRAVSRDDDTVAGSRPEDSVDGADRRLAEETTDTLGERLRDRWDALLQKPTGKWSSVTRPRLGPRPAHLLGS
jgi:hypothetical protein